MEHRSVIEDAEGLLRSRFGESCDTCAGLRE